MKLEQTRLGKCTPHIDIYDALIAMRFNVNGMRVRSIRSKKVHFYYGCVAWLWLAGWLSAMPLSFSTLPSIYCTRSRSKESLYRHAVVMILSYFVLHSFSHCVHDPNIQSFVFIFALHCNFVCVCVCALVCTGIMWSVDVSVSTSIFLQFPLQKYTTLL